MMICKICGKEFKASNHIKKKHLLLKNIMIYILKQKMSVNVKYVINLLSF